MFGLFESLDEWLTAGRWQRRTENRLSRSFRCRCDGQIFFRNTQCLPCRSTLGYLPDTGQVVAVDADLHGTLRAEGLAGRYKACANRDTPALCNWLLDADDPLPFCVACRLNRTIPFLGDADNAAWWGKIEIAKRRLVAQLLAMRLPVRSRLSEDAAGGLMFDFLRSPPQGPMVMTGHADGLITINVEEADDVKREKIKRDMREPYRTLLGHFRHEVGHYYWDRLVRDGAWLGPCRELFGDERASYAEALRRNYEQGPPPDWAQSHISAYATMHPWEDWAETWAHYLHMVDSMGTALGFGLEADDIEVPITPYGRDDLYAPDDRGADRFLALVNSWLEMVTVLNELARSMGEPDFYPFVMSRPVIAKLQLVQMIVDAAGGDAGASRRPAS